MVWGAFDRFGNYTYHWCAFEEFYCSYIASGGTEAIPPNKGLGSLYYRKEILDKTYSPWAQDRNSVPVDDGAPGHRAKDTMQWWEARGDLTVLRLLQAEEDGPFLRWPADSPDLNPIENLWDVVKRFKNKKRPRTR